MTRPPAPTDQPAPGPQGPEELPSPPERDGVGPEAAQRALRSTQAFLERVAHVARVGGWEIELESGALSWSPQMPYILEWPAQRRPELAGVMDCFAPDARARLNAAWQRSLASGEPFDLELPASSARGRLLHLHITGAPEFEQGRPARAVGVLQDITVQHQSEMRLQASQAMFRTLYESTPAMLHSIDRQGRLLTVSDTWLTSLGYARRDVIGRLCTDFLPPPSAVYVREVVLPDFFAGTRTEGVPLKMICQDGRLIDALWSGVLQRDAQGRAQHGLMVVEDVTEKLARTTELEREHRLRLQIERHAQYLDDMLQERSEMLRVLAHEVRQPLNNASAALQSAAAALSGTGQDAATAALQRARDVMGHVLAGVDNTLAAAALLAVGGEVLLADTDIDTFLAVVLADLPAHDRDRVQVLRQTTTRTAAMDMGLMRLALRNLLTNALKYAPPATPVVVHLTDSDEPLALVIDVQDRGEGFEPELLPQLFQRGVRGRRARQGGGHGLGLYIVRRVLELHGGQALLARNEPGDVVLRLVVTQGAA